LSGSAPRPKQQAHPYVATDSEWDTHLPDPWLSTAFAAGGKVVLFLRPDLPEGVRTALEEAAGPMGVILRYVERDDGTDLTEKAYRLLGVKGRPRLLFYYSPKDVEYAFGWDQFREAILAKKVRQRNHLAGKVGRSCLKDLFGLAREGLAKFAAGLGVPMPDKGDMDRYKARMWDGLNEKPADFLRYAVGDVTALAQAHARFVELFGTLQRECLGMGEGDVWDADSIPMTVGALVARTFERWLYSAAGEFQKGLQFCVRKLGILDPDDRRYEGSRHAFDRATRGYRSPESLAEETDHLKRFFGAKFLFTALDGCGIRWWASRPVTETACFNPLVQGGRCQNENPFGYATGPGADVDIAGCYGEGLRSLTFPVGLPTVWSFSPNEARPTLATWLRANEGELLPGLWSCVVSGPLPFGQDLLFSKIARARDIARAVGPGDEGDVAADFVLLRREVHNAVLTADLLGCLRKVATNSEWAALGGLEVVTACAYRRRDRLPDVGTWVREVMADGGNPPPRVRAGTSADRRGRRWYGAPLEQFLGKLADTRKRYKAGARDPDAPAEDRVRAGALDGLLKLMVNTLYGVLASRFFPVGNAVLANTITARARVGVWMVAKALGLRQVITDGGIYTPGSVCAFRGKKPGLDTLSRMWDWHEPRRGRCHAPMGGLDWEGPWPALAELDRLAAEHVASFWTPYGLSLPFRLEHKTTFTAAAYWSKGDYALATPEGVKYALRGKDRARRDARKRHPTFTLLDHILAGEDTFPADLTYVRGGLLKIGKYVVAQDSGGYEALKGLRPGDSIPEATYLARYNNTHMPVETEAEYLKRRNRKKAHRGKPVPWFERYGPGGIRAVHRGMERGGLRAPPSPPL
jgi:hypothetical protein